MEAKVVKKTKVAKVAPVVKVPGKRRVIEGKVVSTKMEKTVKVVVETKTKHSVYKKVMDKRTTLFAHTDKPLNEGDMVKVMESRPYSKKVKWVVID